MKSPVTQCLAFVVVACSAVMIACNGPAPASDAPAVTASEASADRAPVDNAPAVAPLSPAQAPTPGGPAASAAGSSPSAAAGTASAPASTPAAPVLREIVIPAGTVLKVRLTNDVASDTSTVEDAVHATLAAPVSLSGDVVIPDGAAVSGSVPSTTRRSQTARSSRTFPGQP